MIHYQHMVNIINNPDMHRKKMIKLIVMIPLIKMDSTLSRFF